MEPLSPNMLDNHSFLLERIQLAFRIALAFIIGFSIADLWLAGELLWPLYTMKAVMLASVLVGSWVIRRKPPERTATTVCLLVAGACLGANGVSEVFTGEFATTPLVSLAAVVGAATMLPWGALPQTGIVVFALGSMALPWGIQNGFATLLGYGPTALTAMLLVSIHAARVVRRDRHAAYEAELARRESEERFRELAENAQQLIVLIEANSGSILYANPHAHQLLGRTLEAGRDVAQDLVHFVHPEDRQRASDRYLGTLNDTVPDSIPADDAEIFRVCRTDGEVRWVRVRGFPIRDESGRVYRVGGIISDVTERRRVREKLEEADRFKTKFLANMSHELRTPLNVIIGYNDMLLEGDRGTLPPDQSALIERAQTNAKDLLTIVSTALELSRYDEVGIVLTRTETDIGSLISELADETSTILRNRRLQVVWDSAANLPALYTDRTKLKMVLKNLIDNAIKYTPEGTIRVEACTDEDNIRVDITDSGPGLEPSQIDAIFEPFRQVSDHEGGVGLGLYIVRRLVDALGGTIKVDSQPRIGSTFSVQLPLKAQAKLRSVANG